MSQTRLPKADMHLRPWTSRQRANRAYESLADVFFSGSMSDCAEKGFVRNAIHPESTDHRLRFPDQAGATYLACLTALESLRPQ